MVGFVLEKDITKCKEWILRCLEIGETFEYEKLYPTEYMRAIGFMMSFNAHYLNKNLFKDMNMWFGTFANGLIEYDMLKENPEEYDFLMDFSTQFCFTVGDLRKEDYFLRLR